MDLDLPPPTLVQDKRGFDRLLDLLDKSTEIAVDTEADSFFSYHEKVCLIQVTALDQDFLVDPLAGFDIREFGEILADPKKIKVFHDGEYDILIMKRAFGFAFKNLFDTRVAAATLGSQAPGLASVLKEHFSIELDKSMQKSNWGFRPLTEKQIRYARLDTHFLLPLMHEQKAELAERSRAMIVEGECRRLELISPSDNGFDADEFVRIKGARALNPADRPILRELFVLRESLAAESDQPPFRIMNNETMLSIARARPKHMAELTRIQGFSSKQARKMGDEVLAAIERGIAQGPMRKFPDLQSRDGTGDFGDEEIELHERLKHWRKSAAMSAGYDSAYLLNRHVLLHLARSKPRDERDLARVPGIEAWQIERFGAEILAVIARFAAELQAGTWLPSRRRPPRR